MSNNTTMELDYTNRDYQSILTFLVSAARGFMPEWTTVGEPSDFGTLLLELYAYMGDILNYYIDRVASEPFLASAQRRTSLLGIADMLGYVPVAQSAAGGAVTFTLTDTTTYVNPGDTLRIPSGTVVQTQEAQSQNAIFFETIGLVILGGSTVSTDRSKSVGIQEGQTFTEYVAVSNAAPLQEYVLSKTGVIHRTLVVQIEETADTTITWSYVDNLVLSDPDASVYTTYVDDREYMHIVFGDNVAGRIPPNGATITVTYRYGQGAGGNVTGGAITRITPPIAGVVVTNANPTTGGADPESIDSMRFSIPRAAKVRDRAVTLDDFAALALQVPGVAKAVAIGQFYTQVKVYIAPVGGGYPTQDLENQVAQYLLNRTLVGVSVEMHPLLDPVTPANNEKIYTPVVITIELHVKDHYGQLTCVNAVTQALTLLTSFDNQNFGGMLTQGDVYHTIMAVTGVDYVILNDLYTVEAGSTPPINDITAAPTRILTLDPVTNLHITPKGGLT